MRWVLLMGLLAVACGDEGPANEPPVARLEAAAEIVDLGVPATFDAAGSVDPDGAIVLYRFRFSDGSEEVMTFPPDVQVHHVFQIPGRFQVRVFVWDDAGASASADAWITVTDPTDPRGCTLDEECRPGERCLDERCVLTDG